MLWKKPVAWHCNSYSTATVPDYINNPMFQEIALEKDYFGDASHERFYTDLPDSLGYTREIKKTQQEQHRTDTNNWVKIWTYKKMRLSVWGYTNESIFICW